MGTTDIDHYLESLERHDRYKVLQTLKESEFERTELVALPQDAGGGGPFVRKIIARDVGLGKAYERIYAQQQHGFCSAFVPYIYECYATDAELVVVMEYMQGETLQDYVYRCDPSLDLAARLFPALCDAVATLHESFDPPIIHRDLKPSNVIIRQGCPCIIDFGIARELKGQAETDTMHFGTRAYAPPEQFGYGQTTQRSDVYALGMLLYFCLVEETPSMAVVEGGFADERIPAPLRDVLVRATSFDPNNRYNSVRELAQAFETAYRASALASQAGSYSPLAAAPVPQVGGHSPAVAGPAPQAGSYSPAAAAPVPQTGGHSPAAAAPVPPFSPGDAYKVNTFASKRYIPEGEGCMWHAIGMVWNFVTIVFAALLVATGISMGFDPGRSPSVSDYPAFVHYGWYWVALPLFIISFAWALLDKRRLARKFPRTAGRFRWWQNWLIALAVFVVVMVFVAIALRFAY